MFGEIGPTPLDLRFSLFGIPVSVNPTFWLAAIVLAWPEVARERYDRVIVWMACLFVSILIHEMGHALVAYGFGWPPQVYLYHFGGLAVYSPYHGHTATKSIAISLAGPGAGFLLYGVVWGVVLYLVTTRTHPGELGLFALAQLEWINLYWGLVNLLPVLPLDGGQISRELFSHFFRRNGVELAIKLGIGVAALVALYFFMNRDAYGTFPAILFGLLCLQNIQLLQAQRGSYW